MTFFKGIEQSIAATSDVAYEQLEFYYGKDLELWRSSGNDVYTAIHGKDALSNLKLVKSFIGITQSDDFSVSDTFNAANFQEGFLITKYTDIKAGDMIIFNGGGGKIKWKVEEQVDIGYTTTMFVKFTLSNIN